MILLITTCGIRVADYLAPLQEQIDGSGWSGTRILISDGPAPSTRAGWTTLATPQREGQKKTYWRALAAGVEESRRTDDDRILILEDDVELCTNALPYMERARLPRMLDFVTWYDGHIARDGAPTGIYPANALYFICSQAVTWPRRAAEALLASPEAAAWSGPHGGDVLIARILRGRTYGVHVPNLVQHVGSQSVCSPGDGLTGARTSRNYPGRGFDAASLVAKAPAPNPSALLAERQRGPQPPAT